MTTIGDLDPEGQPGTPAVSPRAARIGARLKAERKARLWSGRKMAEVLRASADDPGRVPHVQPSLIRMLRHWESGAHFPSEEYRFLYCKAFGMSEEELFWSGEEPLTIPDPLRSSFAGDMMEAVKRREFLLGMATTAGFGAVGGMVPTFKHVDPELIPYFQQQLEGHYRADMLLGPRALISTVAAQCNLIGHLIDSADEPTRQRMAVVGMSFATFAAWLYLDAGDIAAALYWHDAAQEMAHRSRDREAVACALVDRAMARTDQGIGAAVVDLCNGALMDAGHLSPELRVFALQQQAHGASLLGDRRQVDALLDAAGRLVDQVDVEVWGTACLRTPHYVEVQRATCYGRLGFASEALGVWQQIIPAAPSTARRDVGVWVARQATLSASLREPERTVEFARHAVKVALETGSARVRRELAATEVTMTPWHAEPVGQDFAEVLAPISEGI